MGYNMSVPEGATIRRVLLSRPSKVSRYGRRSRRVTIPIEIAEILRVSPGDIIEWIIVEVDGNLVAIVKKRGCSKSR